MADVKQDLLGLEYSASFEISGLQEANIDLSLSPTTGTQGTVYGVVTDGTDPIPDATVKLFDSQGQPFQHTMTDADGAYSLDGVPAGSYTVSAVKTGYLLSDAAGVTLTGGGTIQANLRCTAEASLTLGTIAGVVKVSKLGTETPLSGVKVTLMNTLGVAVASTYTVDDGEFAFYDLADGVYSVLASAEGYQAAAPMAATILRGSIVNMILVMTVDTRTYNGTVSGIIRDHNGNAVAGCFVGLFQMVGGVETLVATTKTNTAGKYLFGGVTGGQYLVKAKLEA